MSHEELLAAPLAYENRAFLNSADGRILRILSEYAEPLARFRRERIQDTVVFFGSARFHSRRCSRFRVVQRPRAAGWIPVRAGFLPITSKAAATSSCRLALRNTGCAI